VLHDRLKTLGQQPLACWILTASLRTPPSDGEPHTLPRQTQQATLDDKDGESQIRNQE